MKDDILITVDIETMLRPDVKSAWFGDPEVFGEAKLPPDPRLSPPKPRADWKPETNAKKHADWERSLPEAVQAWEHECEEIRVGPYTDKVESTGALAPAMGQIACICLYSAPSPALPEGLQLTISGRHGMPEDAMLEAAWHALAPLDESHCATFGGHYIRKFDLPYMHLRTALTEAVDPDRQAFLLGMFDPWGPAYRAPKVVDLADRLPNKLALLSKVLLGEAKIDLSQTWRLVQEGDWDTIETGCMQHARMEDTLIRKVRLFRDSAPRDAAASARVPE